MMIRPATSADRSEIEALLDAAFGASRHARTASRLREGAEPLAHLSMVARDAGRLVGSVQFWDIELADAQTGATQPLCLLGPVACAPDRKGEGIGSRLMEASLSVADAMGRGRLVLIGDPEFYGRFGFAAEATVGWSVPGPVERRRLLARLPADHGLAVTGELRAATGAALPSSAVDIAA